MILQSINEIIMQYKDGVSISYEDVFTSEEVNTFEIRVVALLATGTSDLDNLVYDYLSEDAKKHVQESIKDYGNEERVRIYIYIYSQLPKYDARLNYAKAVNGELKNVSWNAVGNDGGMKALSWK